MSKKYVIVISRHFGSGGRQVGVGLSEKLGIPLYDKSILGRIAQEQGVSDERLRKMDEYLNGNRIQNIGLMAKHAALGAGYLYETDPSLVLDREKVFHWQEDMIHRLAEEGPCIIVGRCADYILRDHPNLISIFVTAPRKNREERIAQLHPNHPRENYETHGQFVEKTDRLRAYYYEYHTKRRWDDLSHYDLCVDSSVLGIEGTVDMLMDYIKRRIE